jgi:hypothetical protein
MIHVACTAEIDFHELSYENQYSYYRTFTRAECCVSFPPIIRSNSFTFNLDNFVKRVKLFLGNDYERFRLAS